MCGGQILKGTKMVDQRRGRELKNATMEYLACTEKLRLESSEAEEMCRPLRREDNQESLAKWQVLFTGGEVECGVVRRRWRRERRREAEDAEDDREERES
jgi:hypothetical protein